MIIILDVVDIINFEISFYDLVWKFFTNSFLEIIFIHIILYYIKYSMLK